MKAFNWPSKGTQQAFSKKIGGFEGLYKPFEDLLKAFHRLLKVFQTQLTRH